MHGQEVNILFCVGHCAYVDLSCWLSCLGGTSLVRAGTSLVPAGKCYLKCPNFHLKTFGFRPLEVYGPNRLLGMLSLT